MSIGGTLQNGLLDLLFSATSIANFADATSTAPETSLSIALHNSDPTDSGNQSTNECDALGYARQSTARPGGWTAAVAGAVHPVAPIVFDPIGPGSPVTHWSVGKGSGGTNAMIVFAGTLLPSILVAGPGVTVRLLTETVCTLD